MTSWPIPDWIAAGAGVVAVALAGYGIWVNRRPKRFVYEVVANQSIMPASRYQSWSKLSVIYDDDTLKSPRNVLIRATNTGRSELLADAFDQELQVATTKPSSRIISAVVTLRPEGEPAAELEPVTLDSHSVVVPKILVNGGDSVEIGLLIDGGADDFKVHARIAGFRFQKAQKSRWTSTGAGANFAIPLGVAVLVASTSGLVGSVVFRHSPTTRIPNVVGASLNTATDRLAGDGLVLAHVESIPSGLPLNTVIDEDPPSNSKVAPHTDVSLVIAGPK